MTEQCNLPAERVQKAAASLRAALPEYTVLLSFYEQIFISQEKSRLEVSLEPVVIAPEVLALKRREHLPLVEVADIPFDASAGRKLLAQICAIMQHSENEMAAAAGRVASAVDKDFQVEKLFRSLISGNDDYFGTVAGRIGCDKNTLAFIAYNSLKPSLAVCAEQLSTYLKDLADWKPGYCPVCGGLPAIAALDHEGRRCMSCSFCWHEWPIQRVRCPFCGNTDGKKLSYLYSEAEKAFRVDCCEQCRKYVKVVDSRSINRPIYPPLEQVASLHLDIKARQAGFESGIPLHLPLD